MQARRTVTRFSTRKKNGTPQTEFRLLVLFCFYLIVSVLCTGCFEETQVLTLNGDGSGHYKSVVRLNPQMSILVEMAEKIADVEGLPATGESPLGMVAGNLESTIRARVEGIEGARLLKLEITSFGEGNAQRQIAVSIDFDDINTFLASPMGFENLGLRLSKDADGNLHLKGTPRSLVNIPPAHGGMPNLGMMISQMKPQFGVAGDPEFDALFRRLLDSPRSALTFVSSLPIKETNGALVEGNKVEWNIDIIDAASTPTGDLYEVVLEGEGLEFDVREMPQPPAMSPVGSSVASLLGQPAPAFTLTDLEGNSVSLSDFEDKVVILAFWATWCGPCVVEIPYFINLQNELGEQGFTMVAISTDDGMDVVKTFADEHQINYPMSVDHKRQL